MQTDNVKFASFGKKNSKVINLLKFSNNGIRHSNIK